MCFASIFHILLRKIWNKCVQAALLWESRLISNSGLGTLFPQLELYLSNAIVTYAWVLEVISLFEDHSGLTVHALSISIASLLNSAKCNIVVCITPCSASSTPTIFP